MTFNSQGDVALGTLTALPHTHCYTAYLKLNKAFLCEKLIRYSLSLSLKYHNVNLLQAPIFCQCIKIQFLFRFIQDK